MKEDILEQLVDDYLQLDEFVYNSQCKVPAG